MKYEIGPIQLTNDAGRPQPLVAADLAPRAAAEVDEGGDEERVLDDRRPP